MKKILQLALICAIALGAMTITSCSDKEEGLKNAYTFNGQGIKNAWTGYAHITGSFYGETANCYMFGISGTGKSDNHCFWVESDDPTIIVPNAIWLVIPASKLGQQLNMNLNHDVANEGHFMIVVFSNRDVVVDTPTGWIKVTKNSEHNFTITCEMMYGAKPLEANYTGTFTKYDYEDTFYCGL